MNSLVAFICVLSWLPGPPGFYYQNNAYLSLYPVNKVLCPEINPKTDIIYELYTRYNRNSPRILILDNDESIIKSQIDYTIATVIYFHGFMESGKYGSAPLVRDAYMSRDDHNFIVVNAERILAGPWYLTASHNTIAIAKYTAKMIDYLVDKGMNLKKVHLIGHSLGAHSAGMTGQYITRGRIVRITALDPAKPLFENVPLNTRLDSSDADFVDVIHTSNAFGLQQPTGHADFYPNGGMTQPECHTKEIYRRMASVLEKIFCNHWQSFFFYAESVVRPKSFLSKSCRSWEDYTDEKCNLYNTVYMGINTPNTAKGNYYLRTNEETPFTQS